MFERITFDAEVMGGTGLCEGHTGYGVASLEPAG